MIALLVIACAPKPEPVWSEVAAIKRALASVDADHDERVSAAEWEVAAPEGPPLQAADADADGFVGGPELIAWLERLDPTSFDKPRKGRHTPDATSAALMFPRSWQARMDADRDAFDAQVRAWEAERSAAPR